MTTLPPLCAEFQEILGTSASWISQVLSRPKQG